MQTRPDSFSAPSGLNSLEALADSGLVQRPTEPLQKAEAMHPVVLTPALLQLIDPSDEKDPVALQFVPSEKEAEADPAAMLDPIGDESHSPVAGIIHRYPDRLLLNLVQACPAYCRFCFRRGRVGAKDGTLSEAEIGHAVDYIRQHSEIWEVILSGGEPLSLSCRRLESVLTALRRIPHVRVIRIHTRLPITTPERLTPELLALLKGEDRPVTMLIHCNHVRELGAAQRACIRQLAMAGIPLYSQSVLLKGINDSLEALTDLMRGFVECGIKPHYLHHPDKAKGTRHFRMPLATGIALVTALRGRVSGLCQPTYMLEIPGGYGKVPVLSDAVRKTERGYALRSFTGAWFDYTDD